MSVFNYKKQIELAENISELEQRTENTLEKLKKIERNKKLNLDERKEMVGDFYSNYLVLVELFLEFKNASANVFNLKNYLTDKGLIDEKNRMKKNATKLSQINVNLELIKNIINRQERLICRKGGLKNVNLNLNTETVEKMM